MKGGRSDPFKELSTSEIRMLLKHLEASAKKKKTHKKKPHKKKPKKPKKPKKSDSRKRKRTKKAKMLKSLHPSKWFLPFDTVLSFNHFWTNEDLKRIKPPKRCIVCKKACFS